MQGSGDNKDKIKNKGFYNEGWIFLTII